MRMARRRADVLRLALAIRKLLLLGPGGWWLLWQAQKAILVARDEVRDRPMGALVPEVLTGPASDEPARPRDRAAAEAAALAIDRVARFGLVRPLCLVRSLALQALLTRRGVPGSVIRVGVRASGPVFAAHAWVEWDGTVLGDDPEYVSRFQPLTDARGGPWLGDLRAHRAPAA